MRSSSLLVLLPAIGLAGAALDACVPMQGAAGAMARSAPRTIFVDAISETKTGSEPVPIEMAEMTAAAAPAAHVGAPSPSSACCSVPNFASVCATPAPGGAMDIAYRAAGAAPDAPAETVTIEASGASVRVVVEGTSAYFSLQNFPSFSVVNAQVVTPESAQCKQWQQAVAVVGEQLAPFDPETECIRICNGERDGDVCTPVMVCARAVPPETRGRLGTRFHVGVVDFPHARRLIALLTVDAKVAPWTKQRLFLREEACAGWGPAWEITADVTVVANPRIAKYQVILGNLFFGTAGRAVRAGNVPLPA
jgi:hypothetical protein